MTKVYKNGSNKRYCSVIYKKTNKLSIQQKNGAIENPFNYLPKK